MNFCPSCGKGYAPHSAMCPPCNYWFAAPDDYQVAEPSGLNKKQLGSFAGAVLLLAGLFTPIVGVPFFSVNYYSLSQFSSFASFGFFLLVLCAVSAGALAAMKRYNVVRWPGLASLLIIAYTFFLIRSKIAEAKTELDRLTNAPDMANTPMKGMGGAFMSMIQMQWGWGVLAGGAVLLIVASMLKDERY